MLSYMLYVMSFDNVMLYAMLCYFMLCYVYVICYVMLCYVICYML